MFRKLLFSSGMILTLSLSVFSQSGTLKGKIIDKGTKEPIPFANIVIEQGGKQSGGTTTDFDGNYTIKPIPPGKYDLKATYVGYKPIMVKDIVIVGNQISFQDLSMESTMINIETFEVVDYKVPLIDKDQTSTGGTMTSEEISKMPGRSAQSVAITVGGVFSQDGSMGSIRGARTDGTVTYVDGIRVRGSTSVPKAAIEQVTVITGGTPANYGEATGGILSISTKGASREFGVGFEGQTSQFLDKFGYNMLALNIQGPLIKGRDSTQTTALLGYFIAGEYVYEKDPRPSQIGYWYAQDDILKQIQQYPVLSTGRGEGTFLAADFIRKENLEKVSAKRNSSNQDINVTGKIDVRTTPNTNLTLGGSYNYSWGKMFDYNNMLFNYENNGMSRYTNWRVFGRFTQRFPGSAESKSLIKNIFYTIQGGYSQITNTSEDARHGDNLFNYGYLGKFVTSKIPSYEWGHDDTLNMDAFIHNGFEDVTYAFTPSEINPVLSNYTNNYYALYPNPEGHWQNSDQVQLGGGLLNGQLPNAVNSLWTNVGSPYNGYQFYRQTQYNIDANGSADIGNHAIQIGISYEQLKSSYYGYSPVGLWDLMRQLTNKHIGELDKSLEHIHPVYDAYGTFQDTIWYDRLFSETEQSYFDYNFRKSLGLATNGLDWIDVASYTPDMFSIDMFSADELLNNGSSYVYYAGYDYKGKVLKNKPSFDDFFTQKNEDGRYTRPIAAEEPIYMAGYISDKFAFNDLIFNIGLRVDRFDANQKVLKDPFLLYEAKTVNEVGAELGEHPSNMGGDYVVYVDDRKNPTAIKGYRDGAIWYNSQGIEISDPATIETSEGIAPYLVDPDQRLVNSSAFEDYKPQINYMPRISFSFPISDVALFFAHYDVLTKRPTTGNTIDPTDYFFIYSKGNTDILNNPNLKSEKTIDYELGFQQKLSNSSSLKISAYYRELRNQVQVYRFTGAYPVSYNSYSNIDFGTIKGLIVSYDLRRTANVQLRASYSLQFADGTGSDALSGFNFVTTGQPNLRTTTPLSYDRRNSIVAVVDYRYSSGKDYNGPKITRKIKGTEKVKVINLLQNTGLNITANVGSGVPYSRSSEIVATQLGGSGYLLEGSINGSRMPWQYRIDARLDRDIEINTGKKGKPGRPMYMNIYLEVLNVLNTKNILGVYRATGNADDDGYLNASQFQPQINAMTDPQAFRDQYALKANNPYSYSLPRRIRLGVALSF